MTQNKPSPESPPAMDAKAYRRTLGCFATGVTIITTRRASGENVGLTVNSFNSVSLDPPLVLWSLSLYAQSLPAFQEASHFAVNILAADQVQLSQRFATSVPNKFEGVDVTYGAGGVPMIEGCAAYLQCRQEYRHYGGDHIIFIGSVVEHIRTEREPLIFCKGEYMLGRPLRPESAGGASK